VRAPRLHHIMSAAVSERYHGPIGRSVTDFTVTIDGRTEKLPTAHKYFVRRGNDGMAYDRADVAWLDIAGKGSQRLDVARNAKRSF
jgi:hypothetical protein